ncbi:hypothetical protein VN97_g965 [Penicillium thymicola]|uniref:Uncharacterized protein n=1 Tax=Penicillium thymicola TaxID=293382 RepID=A0AAI9TRR6_PENTH|nr:hypothetical protein VN97_g965 [Penicillium thymicola]
MLITQDYFSIRPFQITLDASRHPQENTLVSPKDSLLAASSSSAFRLPQLLQIIRQHASSPLPKLPLKTRKIRQGYTYHTFGCQTTPRYSTTHDEQSSLNGSLTTYASLTSANEGGAFGCSNWVLVTPQTALFSWVLLGHIVWVVVGTTTFFSLLILAINTVFAQETLAGWVGNYLTKSSGVKVVFESAIVPKWKNGVITFKNVFVSKRPGQGTGHVSKGSPKSAAAAAAARGDTEFEDSQVVSDEEEDTNYTQFDLSIETVNVTLSFTKWLNGKGPLHDVEVKGIRGVVDRRHVYWPEEDLDPKSYRHEHTPGDFEIDSFKMHDLLVTIYQPDNFRPFSVSIFSCDLPQLRKQWLFYDFLSANMMSGSYDNSLFTIHARQSHGFTGIRQDSEAEEDGKPSPWKKHNRIRVDGLNVDHLNRGVQGPFSWIHEGTVDIVADIMLPAENDESLAKVMVDFYDRLETTVTTNRYPEPLSSSSSPESETEDRRFLAMDLRVHLNNVRAVVPIFTRDLSYINNALIRPIVAYINSKRTFIPINCRLVKRVGDFDGSWTVFDSGLMDDLSAATYDAFARDVVDDQARKRRFKKVGFWSLQLAAQAIFMGMAGNIA